MTDKLQGLQNDPIIQRIIDSHLWRINCPWRSISGIRFQTDPNLPPAFTKGFFIPFNELSIGTIYVSEYWIESFNFDELEFIVLHELGHIYLNHNLGMIIFEIMKVLPEIFLFLHTGIPIRLIENVRGLFKRVLFKEQGLEEMITKNQEFAADKYAVLWQGRKNPAIQTLLKLSYGNIEVVSHFTKAGSFEFPVITIGERIEAIRNL